MTRKSRLFFSISAVSVFAVSFFAIASETSGPKPAGSAQATTLPQTAQVAGGQALFQKDGSDDDLATTVRIRKGIAARKNLSVNARNLKFIAGDGRVVLKGIVTTGEEKRLVGEIANGALRRGSVDNQLEVNSAPSAPTGLRVIQ
jgi:osmotically-inducible protein OsmY